MPLLFDCLDEESRKVFNDLLAVNHLKRYEPKNRQASPKSHQNRSGDNRWKRKWGKQLVQKTI